MTRSTPSGPHRIPSTVQVLIADDHAVVRDGLRALVEAQPGLRVVGEASTGEEAHARACELRPDVVLLDLSMPGGSGAEAADRIARDCPTARVIALTMHEERGYVARVLRAGAAGYLSKRSATAELVRAIRTVASGGHYVDPSLVGTMLVDARSTIDGPARGATRLATLTTREQDVLRLVARGHSNKEIAGLLDISVKTVETHKANGMTKLGLATRAALVRFAMSEGWLSDA